MPTDLTTALGRPLTRLGLAAAAFVAVFAAVYVVTVRTVPGRELGDASLRGALQTTSLLADTVDAVLDIVSVASLLAAVAVVATIALLRLQRVVGLAAIGILVGANASTWLLKEVLLTRPDLGLREYTPATLNSMPSGHSTAVFSAVAALVFVLPRAWRPAAATLGAAFAALTALATMSAGWHRGADSVAAFLVVGVWTAAAAAAVIRAEGHRRGSPDPAGPQRPSHLVATGAASLALGSVVAIALVAVDGLRETSPGQWAALLSSALFIAGAAALVSATVRRMADLTD